MREARECDFFYKTIRLKKNSLCGGGGGGRSVVWGGGVEG